MGILQRIKIEIPDVTGIVSEHSPLVPWRYIVGDCAIKSFRNPDRTLNASRMRKLDGPRVALGYGSYEDAVGSAGIGHWDGPNGYSVQVGARHVGGFSATNPGICNGPDDPFCTYDPDDDGFRNTNLAAHAAHTIGSQLLSASLYRSQGEVAFDQGNSNVIEQEGSVNLEGDLATNWTHRLSIANARG